MSTKGALSLLASYGGDSSDEEVPGCRVSTKRTHKDDEDVPNTKRFERLPLPDFMLEEPPDENTDDPTLHEGRIRSFPHERGNWATYVYIPFESNEGLQQLLSLVASSLHEDVQLNFFEDFHISLTRTVILKHHWINPFVNTLKKNLTFFTRFIVMLSSLDVYCNEEKTRTFVGLQIKTGYDSLLKLVQCVDNCLEEFKLPKFYENPAFHVSVGWCLGDCTSQLKMVLPQLNKDLEKLMTEFSQENWYIYVKHIMCKSGNKLFQFNLT